jgi:hypothetical protein
MLDCRLDAPCQLDLELHARERGRIALCAALDLELRHAPAGIVPPPHDVGDNRVAQEERGASKRTHRRGVVLACCAISNSLTAAVEA